MEDVWSLRRATDGKVAGVCSALATRWDVDPLVVRIGAVLLALSAGAGAVLYLFAWALLPREDEQESPVQRYAPGLARQSREFWLAAVIIVTVAVAFSVGSVAPLGLMPAVVVVAVWYFGFRRPQRQARDREQTTGALPTPGASHDPFAGPETAFTSAAREWQQTVLAYRSRGEQPDASRPTPLRPDAAHPEATRTPSHPGPRTSWSAAPAADQPHGRAPGPAPVPPVDRPSPADPAPSPARPVTTAEGAEALSAHTAAVRQYLGVPDPAGLYTAPPPADPPAPQRRRGNRVLLGVLLAALVVVLGSLGALDAVTGWPIVLSTYLGAALAVAAVACVVAAFTGRFRGLAAITVLLAISAVTTGLGQAFSQSPAWSQSSTHRYDSLAELPASDGMEVGTVEVDLSGLEVTEDRSYVVRVDAGVVRLVVPEDQHVQVEAVVDVGTIRTPAGSSQGIDLRQTATFGDTDEPRLTIRALAEAGTVEVVAR
ncbi:PspC domain-containing protein [Desertihabitans brevis]|nr:PspC domain-containing protein [Desertihabitans brevis]